MKTNLFSTMLILGSLVSATALADSASCVTPLKKVEVSISGDEAKAMYLAMQKQNALKPGCNKEESMSGGVRMITGKHMTCVHNDPESGPDKVALEGYNCKFTMTSDGEVFNTFDTNIPGTKPGTPKSAPARK